MCTDDYQFRHYSAVRPKQCRRFLFINEDDIEKAFLVNISQFQQDGEVALCKIIVYLSSKGLPIASRSFYWPKFNVSVEPGDYCKVPFSALSDKQIVFHSIIKQKDFNKVILPSCFYQSQKCGMEEETTEKKQLTDDGQMMGGQCDQCIGNDCFIPQRIKQPQNQSIKAEQITERNSSNQQQVKQDQIQNKRIKQPQRQIGQVIIAVKKWRKLYQSKRLNLTKAAKLIGISKKSLDDYFLVLRVGQILGFDYDSNMNSKMGHLRAYIRTFDHKITGKLTKEVKCFELVPDFQVDQLMQQEIEHSHSNNTQFSEH